MILIDASGLIALQEGAGAFSVPACERLEEPGSKAYVSAITAFEIGQKHASGKLTLPLPPGEWFEAMLRQHQLEELPVTSLIACAAADLPPIDRDPFEYRDPLPLHQQPAPRRSRSARRPLSYLW